MQNVKDLSVVQQMLEIQKKLFLNVIDNISEEDSERRPNKETNHIKWISGHLIASRYMMLSFLGVNLEFPYNEQFSGKKKIDEINDFPTLDQLKEGWEELNSKLQEAIQNADESTLSADAPFGGKTIRDLLIFLTHHEAYHIGQISILRKVLGYDSMKYGG
jgi:uncharacterized damage-inducible protein DinB